MKRVAFIITLFCIFLITNEIYAKMPPSQSKTPITIEALQMSIDGKHGIIDFIGKVVATKKNMKVFCDRMRVFMDNKSKKIKKIMATGNVKVIIGDKVVTSKTAIYHSAEEKIIFSGNPKAWMGENVVSGDRIIYFIKDERTIVETTGKRKVNAVIIPEEKEGAKSGKTE